MRRLIATLAVWAALTTTVAADDHRVEAKGADEIRDVLANDLDALFLLQDATARGRNDAAALQKQLLVSIGGRFTKIGRADPNMLAPLAAGYVLSGGNPDAVAELTKSAALTPSHRHLLEGVSLFMRGERDEAAKLLRDMDTAGLPARIAGRVALAQSLLEQEFGARQERLSTAIAAMPGTLVEESALRRSALAFAEAGDENRFWRRLKRYQRRFPDSLYAKTFWQDVMFNLVKWSTTGKPPDAARLDLILQDMALSRRREIYLHLARQAAKLNEQKLVGFASRRVHRLAVPGSQEDQTARFYMSLYDVVSEKADSARAELEKIDRNMLLPHEQALLEAALWIAQEVNRPAAAGSSGIPSGSVERSPLQERAESLLSAADKVLSEIQS